MRYIETLREFIKEAGGPLAGDALDDIDRIAEALAEAEKALEPFARAADICDNYPPEMACLRASFDYLVRSLGRDNSEIIERESVRVSDLQCAAAALLKLRSLTNAKA